MRLEDLKKPANESEKHWCLKRIGKRALFDRGCHAVAVEMELYDFGLHRFGGIRTTPDLVGIGSIINKRERTQEELEHLKKAKPWLAAERFVEERSIGIFIAECKASLSDLKAGMITQGGNFHYCIVPWDLKDKARECIPKHVGLICVERDWGKTWWRNPEFRWKITKPARRQVDAILPLWHINISKEPPARWGYFLLRMGSVQTRFGLRWQI
jgi:hypothetical protein